MLTLKELQRRILMALQLAAMNEEVLDLESLCHLMPDSSESLIEKAVYALRAKGLVIFQEYLGENGLQEIELSPHGFECVETIPSELPSHGARSQTIVVNGGTVQIGDRNVQRIRSR